jgi:hypothetical protein
MQKWVYTTCSYSKISEIKNKIIQN